MLEWRLFFSEKSLHSLQRWYKLVETQVRGGKSRTIWVRQMMIFTVKSVQNHPQQRLVVITIITGGDRRVVCVCVFVC